VQYRYLLSFFLAVFLTCVLIAKLVCHPEVTTIYYFSIWKDITENRRIYIEAANLSLCPNDNRRRRRRDNRAAWRGHFLRRGRASVRLWSGFCPAIWRE
jgi:hypothetical protein